MNKVMKSFRAAFALVLAFSLAFCLCSNGFTAFAAEKTDEESQNDRILKEFFGDGVSTDEAFDKLMAETETMVDYENLKYQYVTNKNSYYVALGDETAKASKQVPTYVDKLAEKLGIADGSYENLAEPQMTIQDVYSTISENSKSVKKADLISIGFSNFGATYFMCKYMAGQADMVTEADWIELVGEENMPLVEDLLDKMFKNISASDLSDFSGYDLEGGLECYAYAYLSNAIHQSRVIEAIREINADAVIVLVGTYNDLENIKLDVNGETMDLGDMMGDLVNASNLLATKNAAAYSRVAYVDAPDVATTLDANVSKYTTPKQYVFAIVGRQGLPNDIGHEYIAQQIYSVFTDTCGHFLDEGVITTEATCTTDGVRTHLCTWCGEECTTVVPAGHAYNPVVTDPTCTEGGYTKHTCEKCGDSYITDETKAVGHSWDAGVVTKEPTATTDGEMTYTCTVCGETKTEAIEKTGDGDVLLGDVTGDGRINSRDARALLRYLAGLITENELDLDAANFNGDNRINVRDARAILNYIAGLG